MERLDDFVEVVIVNDPSEQPLDLANLMCDTARPNDEVEATWASSDAGKHWRCAPGKSTLCRMAIHLTKELEAETDAKVRSGVYDHRVCDSAACRLG